MADVKDRNKEKETIEKLQNIIEQYEREKFDESDLIILHKMIDLWKAFEVFGKVAQTTRNIAIWVAGFTILWFSPFSDVLKAIRKMVGLE